MIPDPQAIPALAGRHRGATLTSFLVAAALSGVIGLVIVRLTAQQGEALLVVSLVDERERLLKDYANKVVEGWDKTRPNPASSTWNNTGINIFDRNGTKVINASGSELGDNNEWTIKAIATDTSSPADVSLGVYNPGGTVKATKVRLVLTFDPAKHPVVNANIAQREEWIYLHNENVTAELNTNCDSGGGLHPSQKEVTGTPPVTTNLYPDTAQGAISHYDFNTNYAKCSTVPLIKNKNCGVAHPIVGFDVNGLPICSTNYVSIESGRCLVSGDFIRTISATGVVTCNSQVVSNKVAIMNPVSATRGCDRIGLLDDEPHLSHPDWSKNPSGNPPRSGLRDARGFQGLANNGTLLTCTKLGTYPYWSKGPQGFPNYQRGEQGDQGDPGPPGPRGFRGPRTKGPKGDRGTEKGDKGSCYTKSCDPSPPSSESSGGCSFDSEYANRYSYNAVECTDNCQCNHTTI